MKKTFKYLLIIFFLLTAVGCQKKEDQVEETINPLKQYVGTYNGTYTKYATDPDYAVDVTKPFGLSLDENGRGYHTRDGHTYDITWQVDGETFTMAERNLGNELEYKGTIKNNIIEIYNGDPTSKVTMKYVYEKEEM